MNHRLGSITVGMFGLVQNLPLNLLTRSHIRWACVRVKWGESVPKQKMDEEAEEERESCLIDGKPQQGSQGWAERGRFHMVTSDDCTFIGIVQDC